MIDLSHSPIAFVTGVISGFMVSIPVGPINVAIINEARGAASSGPRSSASARW